MNQLRHKYFLTLFFLAAGIFLSLSIGGEFLHNHLHHHQTKVSHDECPVSHLLTQVLIFVATAIWMVQKVQISSIVPTGQILVFSKKFLLPALRAPPSPV